VIGLEREVRFVEMARREVAKRGLSNTTVFHGDAAKPSLDKGNFDFVHERLLLINMPEQSRLSVLAHMVELARPGGVVAAESWDRASLVCYPEHPSWVIMNDAYREAIRATNGDGTSGRTLSSLLRQAGLADIRTKVHVRAAEIGDPRRRHRLNVISSARPKIVDQGLLTEAQYLTHTRALADHLADPATLLIDQLFIQSWGRRPS
jgi:SAM-dependent methyltransferase